MLFWLTRSLLGDRKHRVLLTLQVSFHGNRTAHVECCSALCAATLPLLASESAVAFGPNSPNCAFPMPRPVAFFRFVRYKCLRLPETLAFIFQSQLCLSHSMPCRLVLLCQVQMRDASFHRVIAQPRCAIQSASLFLSCADHACPCRLMQRSIRY